MEELRQEEMGMGMGMGMDMAEEPVSPTGQYFNSSALSISILCVLESQVPIDDSPAFTILRDVFLPINPRFSSLMVRDKDGAKQWKKVEVNLKNHVTVPVFPPAKSPDFLYDDQFDDYLAKIAADQLPQSRPLWEIHIVKYPTRNAAGHVIFKLHHALGDGFSLMGALLSCMQRADDPSLPITFPALRTKSRSDGAGEDEGVFRSVPRIFAGLVNTASDFVWSVLKSGFVEDDRTAIRSGDAGVEFRPVAVTTTTFSLDHIKQIKSNLRVTINDVITGIIFLGTRLYMKETSGDHFSKSNSTALVLLNTRNIGGYKTVEEMANVKSNADTKWGNQFGFLHVAIPDLLGADYSNPTSFVFKAQEIIGRNINSAAVYITAKLLEALRKYRGPEATARYIHRTLKNSSMTISNMIGPLEQLAFANHPCAGMYFMVFGVPQSLTITMVSYMGKLRIAVGVEKGHIDPDKFRSCIHKAFEMMLRVTVPNSVSPANL